MFRWRSAYDRFADEISKNELEEFFLYLRNERGLSGTTVNHTMSCTSKVFTYLCKKELLEKNPFDNLSRFSLDKIKRGIPTETEVAKLMNLRWKNDTAKAAFCLAAFLPQLFGKKMGGGKDARIFVRTDLPQAGASF